MQAVCGSGQDGKSERSPTESSRALCESSLRAVLPWVIAAGAALLLTRELSPPRDPIVSPGEPSAQPPDQKQNDGRPKKEEIVYEPWEMVCT